MMDKLRTLLAALTSAPLSKSIVTTFVCPSSAAIIKGGRPSCQSSVVLRSVVLCSAVQCSEVQSSEERFTCCCTDLMSKIHGE